MDMQPFRRTTHSKGNSRGTPFLEVRAVTVWEMVTYLTLVMVGKEEKKEDKKTRRKERKEEGRKKEKEPVES